MKSHLLVTTSILLAFTALAAAAQETPVDREEVTTVIVTARPNPEDPRVVRDARAALSRTPGAVAVVANETYENRLAVGMPDLLRDVPGVLSNKRYGEESRLSIRGSGIDQAYHQRGVLIAQDGIPYADADGFSDFQKVDALGARYVEVYKGGNTLRFGGAQLGGAVNLVTPTGKTAESPNLIRVEGGSYATLRGQGAIARTFDNWDLYGSVSAMSADGYRVNSQQDQKRASLNLGYSFGDEREVRVIASGADIEQGVPGTLTLSDALATPKAAGVGVVVNQWARDQTTARVSVQTHWRFSDSLVFDGAIDSTSTDIHHPIPIVIDQSIHTQGLFGRFDWNGTIAGKKADLFYGLSYRQGVNNQGLFVNMAGQNGFQFGNARLEATGLDVFAEGRLFVSEQFALVAGGSYGQATRNYTDRNASANNADKTFDWFSPRIGLLWESEQGNQVYANLTRSVEPPHYGALVQSPYPQFVPVVPQQATTAEVGTRGKQDNLTWDVTLYSARIERELLSFNPAYGYPAAFFNAGKTIHTGLEASLDWRVPVASGRLVVRQTYAWSDFRFDNDATYGDNRLPVVPEHQYRLALNYAAPNGLFVEPSIDWRLSKTWVDYENTLKAAGYALLNLSTGLKLKSGVTLFLDARNLTDEVYVAEFGAVTDATTAGTAVFYPGEGRSLFTGISYRF